MERQLAKAMTDNNPREAERILSRYRGFSTANRDVIRRLDRELPSMKARLEAEERREAQEVFLKKVPRLVEKYGVWLLADRATFIRAIMSMRTVAGDQFFSDVEIVGEELRLWVSDPSRINTQNLGHFADIADQFVVWCRCPGTTTVGFDLAHLGLSRRSMYRFVFEAGRQRSIIRWGR
jgi:hypothetical protein